MKRLPRIAIAGIAIESSTFTAHRAGDRDFRVWTGQSLTNRYAAIRPGGPIADAAIWLPTLAARAIPGGAVDPGTYRRLRDRIVNELTRLALDEPLDGLFLDIHGAMSVVGMRDAEADFLAAIRNGIGQETVISASMDLHGNVSQALLEDLDLVTCYRMAPHEDEWETRDRALTNLVEALASGHLPAKAWVPVPLLLPGEKTSTRVEPARSVYAAVPDVEARPGITDAGIWMGYPWADEPRCHAAIVVTGTDAQAAAAGAEELATRLWQARHDFQFVGPTGTLSEAIELALASKEKPYVVSDSGDNPGAGGAGDVTWTLAQLLDMPQLTGPDAPVTVCASIFDEAAWEHLAALRVGDTVDVTAGARVDAGPHGPVRIHGLLTHLSTDDPDAGGIAVIAVGGLHVIMTQHRKAFHKVSDFTQLGLDVHRAQIIVTKIGYLEPELHDIARGWTLALTPGGVDQELTRLGHQHLNRPLIPFDDDSAFGVDGPDLTARVFPPRRT